MMRWLLCWQKKPLERRKMNGKNIYFLSGLPRSGSTLLGSILAQNPDIYVTPTSPLQSILEAVNKHFIALTAKTAFDYKEMSERVYSGIISGYYSNTDRPIIFDKDRQWPVFCDNIPPYLNPNPRAVCTVRPLAEVVTSFIVLADKDPNNFIDRHLSSLGIAISNDERAQLLWEFYLYIPYNALRIGLEKSPENILLVDYRDIVFSPEKAIKKIYDFCKIEPYNHQFSNLENLCPEPNNWCHGIVGLHDIRPELKVESRNPAAYLSEAHLKHFAEMDARLYG